MIHILSKIYWKKSTLCIIMKFVYHKQELWKFWLSLRAFSTSPIGDFTCQNNNFISNTGQHLCVNCQSISLANGLSEIVSHYNENGVVHHLVGRRMLPQFPSSCCQAALWPPKSLVLSPLDSFFGGGGNTLRRVSIPHPPPTNASKSPWTQNSHLR
jgi:hypothetical protein